MAGETFITTVGNLVADPELRYTQGGVAVASFTIASTPRFFDRQANEWKDGDALFMRCSAWRDLAEHISGSLTKGARVIASGRLQQKTFQTREGENRTSLEMEVEEIGPSLKFATAAVTRAASTGQPGAQPGAVQRRDASWQTPSPNDSANAMGDAWAPSGATYSDDTPF